MRNQIVIISVLLIVSLSSCEYLLDEMLDDMFYNARCEVVHQGELTYVAAGKSQMKVKVKNKGSLDARCVKVYADLNLGDQVVERQCEIIDYLCSRSSETVTVTFRTIVYGSEYDVVNVRLSWTEVERDDEGEDDYDW